MKKFLVKVILLAIAMLFPLYIADYIVTKKLQSREYYPFSTWNDIINGRLNSDTWILGSSRAWVQYNPQILDSILDVSSYNLGVNAERLYPELQRYKIANAYNPAPKYILFDLFLFSLSMDIIPRSKYIYSHYIYDFKVRSIIRKNDDISLPYLYLPFYRYKECNGGEMSFTEPNVVPFKGFDSKDSKWNNKYLNQLDTVNYLHEPDAIALLEDFLDKRKKEGISVILIHSPFYREGFEKIKSRDEMLNLFRSIAERNGVPFLDYTNDPLCYDTMYFYNAMHLNAHGADLFSTKLAHDLDSLGLIPARK